MLLHIRSAVFGYLKMLDELVADGSLYLLVKNHTCLIKNSYLLVRKTIHSENSCLSAWGTW